MNERAHVYLRTYLGHQTAEQIWTAGQKIHDLRAGVYFAQSVVFCETDAGRGRSHGGLLRCSGSPWGFEFICSPHYLNKEQEIYPGVLEAAGVEQRPVRRTIMTGGIGSGKTTLALYTNAYQLYCSRACARHTTNSAWTSSEILLIFQA